MIDGTLSPDTWIPIGSTITAAVVVIGVSVKGATLLSEIRRDLRELRRAVLPRAQFERWSARLNKSNPALNVPELDQREDE